jgi:hypothetical protein
METIDARWVGSEFDLYAPTSQRHAAMGLRDGFLPEAELRALCASVIRHAERLDSMIAAAEKSKSALMRG